jgi:hypothetical protein
MGLYYDQGKASIGRHGPMEDIQLCAVNMLAVSNTLAIGLDWPMT